MGHDLPRERHEVLFHECVKYDLRQCADSEDNVSAVLEYHKENRTLTELYLYENTISDKGATALAAALTATLVMCLFPSARNMFFCH